MDKSNNGPQKLNNPVSQWVWYEGTDILRTGEAVCFNTDYGTAATADARRCNRVERPSTSNNMAFAGVAARDYSAKSTGQLIEIYAPGSQCVPVALGVDTVIDTGILVFTAGTAGSHRGRFVKTGFSGRGAIKPRQTVTAVLEASMTGAWYLALDGLTLTVVSTAGLVAGDTVVLLGGANNGTGAIVPGKYTIASITNGTVLVLSASAVTAAPGAALTCTGYAYTGNPTCISDLLDGEECGGSEFVSPPDTGGAAVMTYMVGGWTYVCGGVTVGSAVANGALAQGTVYGLKKAFAGLGTLTTNGATVTLAGADLKIDGSTALDLITINAAAQVIVLEWNCAWLCKGIVGATAA